MGGGAMQKKSFRGGPSPQKKVEKEGGGGHEKYFSKTFKYSTMF